MTDADLPDSSHPARWVAAAFAVAVTGGTLLLLLPVATTPSETTFTDALFTACARPAAGASTRR